MATLALCEISQSQLSQTPIINGQLICCTDTGNIYRDLEQQRIILSENICMVSSLPLAPIANKVYLLRPDQLYIYDDDWILLNAKPSSVFTANSIYDFPAIGDDTKIYISTLANKSYRWDNADLKYYCVGSDYNDINTINGGSSTE